MGADIEGSSDAAQRAQEPAPGQSPDQNVGVFSRLANFFSKGDQPDRPNRKAAHGLVEYGKHGLGNLHNKRLEDVAVPRAEIVSVASTIKLDELVEVFRDSGLTRLPVFEGTLDTPIGLIHLKDLALKHGFNGKGGKFSAPSMVRPVLYAPPSMPVGVLLQKMQSGRKHMALVIDEYGGVDGLVTIEDLIEQVLGEIEDEHDLAEDAPWKLEKPGCYLAQSRAPLEDFEAEIGMSLSEDDLDDDIDTLGGLVFMLTGRVPVRGEVVRHPTGVEFDVIDADPRRIKRLRVRVPVSET